MNKGRKKGSKNTVKNASKIIKHDEKKCSICLMQYEGYGHNAEPINQGRCCEQCNTSNVIPTRIYEILKGMNYER